MLTMSSMSLIRCRRVFHHQRHKRSSALRVRQHDHKRHMLYLSNVISGRSPANLTSTKPPGRFFSRWPFPFKRMSPQFSSCHSLARSSKTHVYMSICICIHISHTHTYCTYRPLYLPVYLSVIIYPSRRWVWRDHVPTVLLYMLRKFIHNQKFFLYVPIQYSTEGLVSSSPYTGS